jgi:hypothetical protein
MHNRLHINGFVRFSFPTAEKFALCLAVEKNLVASGMRKQALITNITLRELQYQNVALTTSVVFSPD